PGGNTGTGTTAETGRAARPARAGAVRHRAPRSPRATGIAGPRRDRRAAVPRPPGSGSHRPASRARTTAQSPTPPRGSASAPGLSPGGPAVPVRTRRPRAGGALAEAARWRTGPSPRPHPTTPANSGATSHKETDERRDPGRRGRRPRDDPGGADRPHRGDHAEPPRGAQRAQPAPDGGGGRRLRRV